MGNWFSGSAAVDPVTEVNGLSDADADAALKIVSAGRIDGKTQEEIRRELKARLGRLSDAAIAAITTFGITAGTEFLKQLTEHITAENMKDSFDRIRRILNKRSATPITGSAYGAMQKRGGAPYDGFYGGAPYDGFYGGCCIGGVDFASSNMYGGSPAAATKQAVIDMVLKFAESSGAKLTGETTDEKLKSYYNSIKSGSTGDAAGKCRQLAEKINGIYGEGVIDTADEPQTICKNISEILHSLRAGMHVEFLSVYEDVKAALENLQALKASLTDTINNEMAQLNTANVSAQSPLRDSIDISKMLLNEFERQIALINNLLNTGLAPTESTLAAMLEKGDLKSSIRKLLSNPSPGNLSVLETNLQRSLVLTASTAAKINNALKLVGVTREEFKSADTASKLQDAMLKGLITPGDNSAKANAASYLMEHFGDRDRLIAALDRHPTGAHEPHPVYGGAGGIAVDADMFADTDKDGYTVSNIQRRKKAEKVISGMVIGTFYRNVNERFNMFVSALGALSAKVGKEVPVTDTLVKFVELLGRINGDLIHRENIYYALIGYYNDAMSKSIKDGFVGNLKMIASYIDALTALPEYSGSAQYLRDVKSAITGIVDVIDKYSDEISSKFGSAARGRKTRKGKRGGYMPDDSPIVFSAATSFSPALGGAEEDNVGTDDYDGGFTFSSPTTFSTASGGCDCDPKMGGDDEAVYGGFYGGVYGGALGDIIAPKYRAPKTITNAIAAFNFQMKAARIMANLAAVSGETAVYGKDQTQLNANSIVEILAKRQKQYEALKDALKATPDGAEKTAAGEILDSQWSALKGFWAAVEGMDACMRNFTDAVTAAPHQIREIGQILDDIDIIADWYTAKSGNMLAAIFENFPIDNASHMPNAALRVVDNKHYYEKLEGLAGVADVGNPYNVTVPSFGKAAMSDTKKFFQSMAALKNLFSVFVHFGRSIGGDAVSKALMSPARMYEKIVLFLQASAFSQGWNLGGVVGDDGKTLKDEFNDSTAHDITFAVRGTPNTVGMPAAPAPGDAAWMFNKRFGVHMRGVQDAIKAVDGFGFALEDEYFVMMLKAAAAKVLTITGTYNLFNRPQGMISKGISPIRMILGGNDALPEVIPAATALYLRLPLLLQWYRKLFNDDANNGFAKYNEIPIRDNTNLKIAFVPDIDGLFAPLIKYIFRTVRGADTAQYTDDDIRVIVREINLIYQRESSKHSSNVVRGTIHDLINEINRRYGIVNKQDMDDAETDNGRLFDYANTDKKIRSDPYDTELAILPDEDQDLPQRPTPSERMLTSRVDLTARPFKSKYNLTMQHKNLIYNFRCAVDKALETDGNSSYSFNESIASTMSELKSITAPEKRFATVATLVRGSDIKARVEGYKYVLFSETVIAGLNTLSGIHSMLRRFQQRVLLTDITTLRNLTIDWFEGARLLGSGNTDELINYVKTKLISTKTIDNSPETVSILKSVFGYGENATNYTLAGKDGAAAGTDRVAGINSTGDAPITSSRAAISYLLDGLKPSDMRAALKDPKRNATNAVKVNTFFRLLFNRQYIMRELLESIFAITDDVNVKAMISDGRFNMSFGGLEALIKDTFSSVFHYISLLRPHVGAAFAEKYVAKENHGSFYWLQEQIIEKIIVGRKSTDVTKVYPNLEAIARTLALTWDELVSEGPSGEGVSARGIAVSGNKSYSSYERVFAEAVFYDATKENSGLMGSSASPLGADDAKLVEFRDSPYESLLVSGPQDKKVFDSRFAGRFKQLYTWGKEFTHNRSLLFSFNQLVAKFIQSFYDINTSKIYLPLVDKFANGTFARAIADPLKFTYTDIIPGIQIKFGAPAPNPVSQSVTMAAEVDYDTLNALTILIKNTLAGKSSNYLNTTGRVQVTAGGVNVSTFAKDAMVAVIREVKADATDADIATHLVVNPDGSITQVAIITPVNQTSVNTFNEGFASPGAANDALGPIEVIKQYPFADNIVGSAGDDHEMRMRLLAILLLLYSDMRNAGTALPATRNAILAKLKNGTYNAPITSSASSPKTLISTEDLLSIDTSRVTENRATGGASEKSTLLFARPEDTAQLGVGTSIPYARKMKFDKREDPDGEHVLFTSLAQILRTLVSTKTPTCTACSVYVTENIAELPAHMKEKFRANLPAFRTLFAELIKRAEFFKGVFTRGHIDMTRAVVGGFSNPWPYNLATPVVGSQENKNRQTGIIDTIIRGCQTLLAAIDQSMREVGDGEPKYLETHAGSIREYAAQNGGNPLMPISTMLAMLKNHNTMSDAMMLFPVHSLGEVEFKLMYGTRGLFSGLVKHSMDAVVGFADIITNYNMLVSSQFAGDAQSASAYLDRFLRSVKFIHGAKSVKGLLSSYHSFMYTDGAISASTFKDGVFIRDDFVVTDTTRANNAPRGQVGTDVGFIAGPNKVKIENKSNASMSTQQIDIDSDKPKVVFAIATELAESLRLTESSNRDDMLVTFVNYINGATAKATDLALQNIIDLDVVPINVHAMMREMPFATLINYAYTCDRMFIELFYGLENANANKLITELCGIRGLSAVKSSKDMLVAMLIDPYMSLEKAAGAGTYVGDDASVLRHLNGMLTGATGVDGLGRPRFLSDEVYGKAIFGQLYTSAVNYREMGPGASYDAPAGAINSLRYLRNGAMFNPNDAGAIIQPDNDNTVVIDQVGVVNLGGNIGNALAAVGAARMNTVLIRNLIFIINLLRALRLQLSRDLHHGDGPIVSSNANIAPRITEMFGNQVAKGPGKRY